MKHLYRACIFMALFPVTSCTEDHSFSLDEKRQIIIVHNLLRLRIESDSSQTSENQLFRVCKINKYDTKEIEIISLQHKSPGIAVEKMNDHGFYEGVQIINLLPNRKYTIIIHSGMGGRVHIQEYFLTDSIGNLRVDQTRKRKVGYRDVIETDRWGT